MRARQGEEATTVSDTKTEVHRKGTQGSVSPEVLRQIYVTAVRSRVLDERIWVLNRQGRAPFWISGMGHEVFQSAVGTAVDTSKDWLAPYYRDLALTLAFGMSPKDHFLSALAKADDPNSGGRQMPAHFGNREHNIVSTGSPVATQMLHAAGVALGMKLKHTDALAVTSLGEGSTSGGDFHEALNFAAVHKLPVLFLVENNGYAISVPLDKQMPTSHVSDRARAYGIPGVSVDGGDAVACYEAAMTAVERARKGEGPTLIEGMVARLTSHSSDDDERRYRPAEEIESVHQADCLVRLERYLLLQGVLTEADLTSIRDAAVKEIDVDMEAAEQAPLPEPETALRYVYAEEA